MPAAKRPRISFILVEKACSFLFRLCSSLRLVFSFISLLFFFPPIGRFYGDHADQKEDAEIVDGRLGGEGQLKEIGQERESNGG